MNNITCCNKLRAMIEGKQPVITPTASASRMKTASLIPLCSRALISVPARPCDDPRQRRREGSSRQDVRPHNGCADLQPSRTLHEDAEHGRDMARTNTRTREDGESNGQQKAEQEIELFSLVLIFVKDLPKAFLVGLGENSAFYQPVSHTTSRPHGYTVSRGNSVT